MQEIKVTKNEAGQRLDKLLAKYLNEAPKSFFYKMMRKKNIVLNGKKATGNEKLEEGYIQMTSTPYTNRIPAVRKTAATAIKIIFERRSFLHSAQNKFLQFIFLSPYFLLDN